MDNFSSRLKKERQRMGLSQANFARQIGCCTNVSQSHYETGKRSPDAEYLIAVAAAGVDVQYLLTGVRSDMALSPEERTLLSLYRSASPEVRAVTLAALKAGQPGNTRVVTVGRDNNGTITL